MKLTVALFVMCCMLYAPANSQVLETVIRLPDTLGPLNGPYHLACTDDPAFPRLYIGGESDSGGVIVADAITCKRLARIPTGRVRTLCYVQPHRKLYVGRPGFADSVWVVDCATNQIVATVPVPGPVAAMLYDGRNDRLYCGGTTTSVIDCAADTVTSTIPVMASVFALNSADNKIYCGNSYGTLAVVDCYGDSVIASIPRIAAGTGALQYNKTAKKIYAVSGDTLFAVDARYDSVVAALGFAGLTSELACDEQRNRVYCVYTGHVASIDCTGDSVLISISAGPAHMACNAARDLLYLTYDSFTPELDVLNGTTGQFVALAWLDGQSSGMSWSPGLDRLYCFPHLGNCLLAVVGGASNGVVGVVPLLMRVDELCLDSTENTLYFLYSSSAGCIGAADCSRNVVTSYMYAGAYPMAICYGPNNGRLYCGTYAGPSVPGGVSVFDCSADTFVKRIPTSNSAEILRLHPALNKLYVASSYAPDIFEVIDCGLESIVGRIPLPGVYQKQVLLVPERNRLVYLGAGYAATFDCLGDTVIADTMASLGGEDACYSSEDRKVFASYWESSLKIIDIDNPAQVETLPGRLSANSVRFFYVPKAHKVYWCHNYEGYPGNSIFRVIDSRTNIVVDSFWAGRQVDGMCLDHTGDYVYCVAREDSAVLVLDTRADSVVATLGLPSMPRWAPVLNTQTNRIYVAQWDVSDGIPVIKDSMVVGLADLKPRLRFPEALPTVISRDVPLRITAVAMLYDPSGRRVAVLWHGLNDISRVAPGVYFMREVPAQAQAQAQAVRKVVITR